MSRAGALVHCPQTNGGQGLALNDPVRAGPAGILGATGDYYAELSRDDIQPLGCIFANHMALSTAAADRDVRRNYLFDVGQMLGQ